MKVLEGHESAERSYVVDDYPYGFRLRTQIRYWIETKPKHGQRFCSQTMNPKTGRWNKPKAGTYAPILLMVLDEENGHVHNIGLGGYADEEEIARFEELYGSYMHADNYQRETLRYIKAARRASKHFTVSIHSHEGICGEACRSHQTIKEQAAMYAKATRYELWQETAAAIRGDDSVEVA